MIAIGKYCLQRRVWSLMTRLSPRNLCVTATHPKIDNLIAKVDADVRRFGRITERDLLCVYETVKEHGFSQPSQSLVLLRCCGSLLSEVNESTRNEIVDNIWSMISSKDVALNVSHYNSLLNAYIENNRDFNPTDILAEMESKGIEPNRVTYQRLLHRFCQCGDVEGAMKILEHMKSKSLPLTEAIFNSLILGYSRAGDIESSIGVMKQMQEAGIEPSNNSYRSLLCALVEKLNTNAEVESKIDSVLNEIAAKEIMMCDRDWLDVVKAIALVDENSPRIDAVLQKCNQDFGYNQDCYILILELINNQKLNVALKVFYAMKPKNEDDVERKTSGIFLLKHLVKSGVDKDTVIRICEELSEKGINEQSYSKLTQLAMEFCDLETSKFYLKVFLAKSGQLGKPHYFWPLLAKCNTEEEILQVLEEDLCRISVNSSFSSVCDTFSDYVWPKVKTDVYMFLDRCADVGFSNLVLVTSLIKFNLVNKQLDEVVKVVNQEKYFQKNLLNSYITNELALAYAATGDVENTVSFLQKFSNSYSGSFDHIGSFLINLVSIRNLNISELFVPLVKMLKKADVYITPEKEELILQRNVLNEDEQDLLSSIVMDERELSRETRETHTLSVEELEKQYLDLKSKGIVARGTMRQLLMAYCRSRFDKSVEEGRQAILERRKRIEELLNDLSDANGNFTSSMRALLVQFYTNQCEDLEAALKYKTIDDSVAIDVPKILNLARLMVKKGKAEDAIQLLYDEAKKEREEYQPSARLEIDARMLLTAAEETKDFELVKRLFDAIITFTNLSPRNKLCGVLVKVHIMNNDYKKALEQMKLCVENYGCAPWKSELMRHAIASDDSSTLQTITDLSISAHGEHNTLFDLGIAFIRTGKYKQAKKALSTPGLRVSEKRLQSFAERCLEGNEFDIYEQFVSVAKSLFDVNMDLLYFNLLRCFAKAGNTDKIRETWTQMQEDNVIASDKTLRLLAELLGENGKDVTFAVEN